MAKKKIRKNIGKAIAHVNATFNNTMITITDLNGETLAWDSAGTVGFKGARKATPFAATRAAERVASKAKRMGVREVEVRVKLPYKQRKDLYFFEDFVVRNSAGVEAPLVAPQKQDALIEQMDADCARARDILEAL